MSVSPPRETIVFNPVYPPRYDPKNLTYFGGLPTLSKKLNPMDAIFEIEKLHAMRRS